MLKQQIRCQNVTAGASIVDFEQVNEQDLDKILKGLNFCVMILIADINSVADI